jgi:prefoldin subunit 5
LPADELGSRLTSLELYAADLKREIQQLSVVVEELKASLSAAQKLEASLSGISADIDTVEQKAAALDRSIQAVDVAVQAEKSSSSTWLTISAALAGLALLVALTSLLLTLRH